ncbi:MAG TPA: hypothetical protein VLM40_09580, partial [Gemmata sp.]|nr:hypothetical protein [Gemmata sp.]
GDAAKAALLKFKADGQPNSVGLQELLPLEGTGGQWRTTETEAALKFDTGFFEFHALDGEPAHKFQIRSFEVTELGSGTGGEKVFFELDASDLPNFKNTKQGSQRTAGDSDPTIRGVYFHGWKPESISEWECKTIAGARAIGFTNLNGVNSAQIGIELEQPGGLNLKFKSGDRVRLRVEYRTAGRGRGHMYFQTYEDWKVSDRIDLPNSNDAWNTVDLITTRRVEPIRCLIDTSETGAGNTLFVRSITISDASREGESVNGTPSPRPPASDGLANWAEGATVYTLDLAKIPEFRVVKDRGTRTSGDAEQLPSGIGCHSWKEGAVGEFRCAKVNDVPALGIVNLNDEKSGQFYFSLETGMNLPLKPGKAYREKISYQTRNEATGHASVHVVPGFTGISTRDMPNTDGKWANIAVSFIRPPASDNVEVRMVIDNTSVGEGNTLWFRSVEIVELVPPQNK